VTTRPPIEVVPFLIAAGSAAYSVLLAFVTGAMLKRIYRDLEAEAYSWSAIKSVGNWIVDVQLLGTATIASITSSRALEQEWSSAAVVTAIAVFAICLPLLLVCSPVRYGNQWALTRKTPFTFVSLAVVVVNLLIGALIWRF